MHGGGSSPESSSDDDTGAKNQKSMLHTPESEVDAVVTLVALTAVASNMTVVDA